MWLPVQSSLLPFGANLFTDLFLDLFESLQEELLHVTPLVKNDLAEGLDLAKLRVLLPHDLPQINDLFLLVPNNLLMLVPHELLLFFKIFHDLSE